MRIKEYLKKKKMSLYKLSKMTGIPYSTLRDLATDNTSLLKASAEKVYKISAALGITMEDLIRPYVNKRPSFDNFKSDICQRVRRMGDIPYIIMVLEDNLIRQFYEDGWYPEALYLLAMVDYLSKENNIPICSDYDDLRKIKLTETVFPNSVVALAESTGNKEYYTDAIKKAIPEFLKYNIVESEIRNVC